MTWQTKEFEELVKGDILTSCGGHRWYVSNVEGDRVCVVDLETKKPTWFTKRRPYWAFMVVTEIV
jgi:hypothetical protein